MTYELWDTETRNIVGAYVSEEDALVVVREAIGAHGTRYADTLALVHEDARGAVQTLAVGAALAERALAASIVGGVPADGA